jgi:hypothetical protein
MRQQVKLVVVAAARLHRLGELLLVVVRRLAVEVVIEEVLVVALAV